PSGKVTEKLREKTANKQAEMEAKQIEIGHGIQMLHGHTVQHWHDKIKKAQRIEDQKKREAEFAAILHHPDLIEYLKANKLDAIGRFLKFMHGEPDSRTALEGLVTQEDADAVKKFLLERKGIADQGREGDSK
ncbi:hypothetical protein, partial [Candidatus Magnetobacterium casense]